MSERTVYRLCLTCFYGKDYHKNYNRIPGTTGSDWCGACGSHNDLVSQVAQKTVLERLSEIRSPLDRLRTAEG